MAEGEKTWLSVTNILVSIAVAVNGFTWMAITRVDGRMSHHLENAELHIPRSTVVSKDEFDLYQRMRDRQMDDIKTSQIEIKTLLQAHMSEERRTNERELSTPRGSSTR